jgi:hypothetical protein
VIAVLAAGTMAGSAAPATALEPPRILVTGDSMLMYTDRVLQTRMRASGQARIVRDLRVATGLAKPWLLDWDRHAAAQMRRHRPDVVLVAMGANDIHPIGRSPCCGPAWVERYAGRIGRLARVWRRGGARHVYWATLPIQAHARLEPLFTGVNRAVERASDVEVVDVRPVVNPGGLYHHTLEVAPGVVRQIRYEDGVHVWWAGAALLADAIVARLVADAVILRA